VGEGRLYSGPTLARLALTTSFILHMSGKGL
jgi:hypothetical protein